MYLFLSFCPVISLEYIPGNNKQTWINIVESKTNRKKPQACTISLNRHKIYVTENKMESNACMLWLRTGGTLLNQLVNLLSHLCNHLTHCFKNRKAIHKRREIIQIKFAKQWFATGLWIYPEYSNFFHQ